MPLTMAKLSLALSWVQENAITGFNAATQQGPLMVSVAPPVSSIAAREIYFVRGTLAAGATVTFDLNSITEPAFTRDLTPTGAYLIVVKGSGATWSYGAGSSDQFFWFLSSGTVSGNSGACFAFGDQTPGTISASTKNVAITNTSGGSTLTYTMAVVLKTA